MWRLSLVMALCTCTTIAQQAAGTLRGQVLDELGGAIVGARIVVINANGEEKTVTSDSAGFYSFDDLRPGKYSLRVSAGGFAVYQNSDVEVVAGQQKLNVTLQVTVHDAVSHKR